MVRSAGLVSAVEWDAMKAVLPMAVLIYMVALLQAVANLLYSIVLTMGIGRWY